MRATATLLVVLAGTAAAVVAAIVMATRRAPAEPPPLSDDELITRTLAGDSRAATELCCRLKPAPEALRDLLVVVFSGHRVRPRGFDACADGYAEWRRMLDDMDSPQ